MNIRDPKVFAESFWDWTFLNECFKHNIRVSDIDGLVERNGWFLLIETKLPGVTIPTGQWKMYPHLASRGFTILIVWGKPNEPQEMQVWYPHKAMPQPKQKSSHQLMRWVASRWFKWADENGGEADAA